MPHPHLERLRNITRFDQLIAYLRDELDWPVDARDIEEVTYEYTPDELGIDPANAAKIESIRQLMPLATGQTWGIFFVKFEKKRLPVVALRRILGQLVLRRRASARKSERASWHCHDLLFISSYGEDENRQITFAHFNEDRESGDLPALHVLGWDGLDTNLHLGHVAKELHEKLRWPDDTGDTAVWRERWASAFTLRHREVIRTSRDLAVRLAELARRIRLRVNAVLAVESESGPLRLQLKAFKQSLIHDLKDDDFADMYAQTIAYGLLSARFSRLSGGLVADNAADMVPNTNPFLRELMETFLRLGGRKRAGGGPALDFDELGVNAVVETLRHANMAAVRRDFGDKNPQEDPVIHFYELFLKQYDAKLRMKRGVFYTPRPVVSYIVRSVDELLRSEFGLADGLADTTTWGEMLRRNPDLKLPLVAAKEQGLYQTNVQYEPIAKDTPFVQILDPATGTGTFLVEVIDLIYKTLTAKWRRAGHMELEFDALWNDYVPRHLLPRLHGYELLMAPYAIAHMKIGLKLGETGYKFGSGERVRIYLTNALEPPQDFSGTFEQLAPALAHEAQAVNDVKRRQRFTVVIGNPPYSVSSMNQGKYIVNMMEEYKSGLEDHRNIQPLSDDYVKFLRFADWTIAQSNSGVLGFITNHSYISGVIHRTMRRHMLATFPHLRLTDLHGNSFIREYPPHGIRDENVFQIQQGVSITLGICAPGIQRRVVHSDLWGSAKEKFDFLGAHTSRLVKFVELPLDEIYLFFVPKDFSNTGELAAFIPVNELFTVAQNGVQTGHDGFITDFDRSELLKRVREFFDPETKTSTIRERYKITDKSGWELKTKRALAVTRCIQPRAAVRYFYRPFDSRFIYYEPLMLKRSSPSIMPHLMEGENVALFTMRKIVPTFPYTFFGVVNGVTDHGFFYMGNQGSSSCFPLYLKVQSVGPRRTETVRQHNLNSNAVARFVEVTGLEFKDIGGGDLTRTFGPKNILDFIYATFHSPTYRSRYSDSLKIDFPRAPLPKTPILFSELAQFGGELISLHLMQSPCLETPITTYTCSTRPEVEKVTYSDGTVWLDKKQTCGFAGVPEAVWNFHIGGYQVCHKWLKDRKGRTLSQDDIAHYQKIVVALNETIRLMREIDEVIEKHGGWPGAFATGSAPGAQQQQR